MNLIGSIKPHDTNARYMVQIRKRVLEFQKSYPSTFDVAIYMNTDILKILIAAHLTLDDAMNTEQVEVDGDLNNLRKFVNVLDTGMERPSQAGDAGL